MPRDRTARYLPAEHERQQRPTLADWPVDRPRRWLRLVNEAQSPGEEAALRRAVQRGRPLGGESWEKLAATRMGP